MRRRKWIKRSLLAVALLLTATAAVSYWAFKGTPDYYRRPALSAEERADAANRAEKKLIRTREWANDLWVNEHRSIVAGSAGPATTQAATNQPDEPLTISFTERELNAFSEKWSQSWDQTYRDFLTDPAVILRKDRIILAGTLTEVAAVASLHFFPRIDSDGRLLLTLDSVRAGRLPMPEMIWSRQRDRALAALHQRLPGWQQEARIEPNGVANADAVAAHMSKLLFDVVARRPREPVLFIPFEDDGRAVPVRLTNVQVTDGELTLTVAPLNPAERTTLLERVREPLTTVTASAH
ncbi:MAG TPA: hypothetical protein VGR35_06680 [Tepidisphaeraceae bacterium]|nr:hypothetical protein [Tepidisphaeraceae bacterium]